MMKTYFFITPPTVVVSGCLTSTTRLLWSVNIVIDDAETVEVGRDQDEVVITPTSMTGPDVSNGVPKTNNNNEDYDSGSNEDESAISSPIKKPSSRIKNNHPTDCIIGNINEGFTTQRKDLVNYMKIIGNV